ncbi:LytR/AlgR family response regulator transcription factor [Rhodohalobacter sp. 614A]|uniref:LytR/AlgR family response regulator transcription factor n=1 Tax=Rhodohalobacter sp. 614A TaxID=2908649 RepID=UPI001F21868E|nr:LytTR family DNA-binding domain-containing protein [Rhodohalobacter sp. 614A]
MIRVIVVDDEKHARNKLANLLAGYADLDVVSVCKNGLEAINEINSKNPNLVFLDIEMPEIDGFQVIENIECDPLPYIIFVTAFSHYAVKAFEVEALDYIHKPIDRARIKKSMDRYFKVASNNGSMDEYEERVRTVLREVENHKWLERFIVKKSGEYFLVNANDVFWIEADGNYINIVTSDSKYFVRHTLTGFENHLDSAQFFRISRSVIVNIDWISKIEDHHYGNFMIQMKNGSKLKMSKNYRGILEEFKNF